MHRISASLVLAVATLAGCGVDEPSAPPPTVTSGTAQLSLGALMEPEQAPPRDVCGLLPCDGPCSLACDYHALATQYVPPGSCATFFCELTDGSEIILDACNAPQ